MAHCIEWCGYAPARRPEQVMVRRWDEAMDDARLRAEVRAVEEGHHAFLHTSDPLTYRVISDAEPGVIWYVKPTQVAGTWYFRCTCYAGIRGQMCKHSQLVARRMEREGVIRLTPYGTWEDAAGHAGSDVEVDDPFAGLD